MAISAQPGPMVVYGDRNPLGTGATGSNNSSLAPSVVRGGYMLFDPRVGYNATRKGFIGLGMDYRRVLTGQPAAKAAANIAALANAASGVAMTLVSATGAGVTVLGAAAVVWASGNTIPANSLALDGAPGLLTYGIADPAGIYAANAYDNSKALARAVQITGVVNTAGGDFLVSGADLYGYPQTETITAAAGVATTNGKKAFKFIYSVTPQFTDAHNYSVGTTDIFGFPLRAAQFDQALVWWDSTLITANTGFVGADTTSPATATTGDVRGTYAVQSAADGTKRLCMAVGIAEATCVTAAGAFGVVPA